MANVLVWNTLRGEIHGALCLDEANRLCDEGHSVYLLDCDESIGGCYFNRLFNKYDCKSCVIRDKLQRKRKLSPNIKIIKAKDIKRNIFKDYSYEFHYNTLDELKELNYKGVNIGMGFLSSYIDYTRTSTPNLSIEQRKYVDAHLEQMALITDIIDYLIHKYSINKIVFCNGRLAQLKPALDLAKYKKIDFTSVEIKNNRGNIILTDYRDNTTQHDAKSYKEECEKIWSFSELPLEAKYEIGKSFFENRRHKKVAGDKVYTLNQKENLLPSDWDIDKENIVIFNSSEDEFAALGGDYINKSLYKTQIEGILDIINHYNNDAKKHFYLRVHPNLIGVKEPYHLDLYKIKSANFTLIPPDSPISTYTLMDKSSKIIVFGSTTGIEGAYAKKAVISLRYSYYYYFDVVYLPKDKKELWDLIDTPTLPNKTNDLIYKFGFKIMNEEGDVTKYFDTQKHDIKIFNKSIPTFKFQKIWGSYLLPIIIKKVTNLAHKIYSGNFKNIPQNNNL